MKVTTSFFKKNQSQIPIYHLISLLLSPKPYYFNTTYNINCRNIMKSSATRFFAAAATILLAAGIACSCHKSGTDVDNGPATLEVDVSTVNFTEENASNRTIMVKSNVAWDYTVSDGGSARTYRRGTAAGLGQGHTPVTIHDNGLGSGRRHNRRGHYKRRGRGIGRVRLHMDL